VDWLSGDSGELLVEDLGGLRKEENSSSLLVGCDGDCERLGTEPFSTVGMDVLLD